MSSITLWLSIATAVIAILSAIFSQIEKNEEKAETLEKEKELNQKNSQIIESQKTLNQKNNEIIEKQQELLVSQNNLQELQTKYSDQIIYLQNELRQKQVALQQKTDEVVELQSESINEVTGENSFCLLDIRIVPNPYGETKNMEIISISNIGKYPLQNIQVYIEKPQLKWDKKRELKEFKLSRQIDIDPTLNYSFDVPYLRERTEKNNIIGGLMQDVNYTLLAMNPIPDDQLTSGKITYLAVITLRKGTYQQIFKLSNYKESWRPATKIISSSNPKFHIEERIDEFYPRDQNGQVNWRMIETKG